MLFVARCSSRSRERSLNVSVSLTGRLDVTPDGPGHDRIEPFIQKTLANDSFMRCKLEFHA